MGGRRVLRSISARTIACEMSNPPAVTALYVGFIHEHGTVFVNRWVGEMGSEAIDMGV